MRGERCGKMTQYDYVQRGRQGSPMQCGHMTTDGHVSGTDFFPLHCEFHNSYGSDGVTGFPAASGNE